MPIRKIPIVTDHYYHLFNRSVAKVPIFTNQQEYRRFFNIFNYYRFRNLPLPFSELLKKSKETRDKIIKQIIQFNKPLIEINCFCVMPNHFHFILKQLEDDAIMKFIRNIQNSYAKYFNLTNHRTGSLFQHPYKAILIEDDNQLLHLSRYIHLNPYSSYIVKNKKTLVEYSWFSLAQFLGEEKGLCQPEIILGQFKSTKKYLEFIWDRADYQRNLETIKHLIYE